MRTSRSWVKALNLLGCIPISIPMSDVPEAIQKGGVKGLILSVEGMRDVNFVLYSRLVASCYLPVVLWTVIMNKDKWDSLPPDIKKVMDDMRKEHSMWTGNYNDRHEKEAVDFEYRKV